MPEFKPRSQSITPYWQTTDGETCKLFLGDTIEVMKRLPEKSAQCVVTSPPYYNLRDYGTATWVGGTDECDHVERYKEDAHRTSTLGPSATDRARGDYSRVLPAENAAFKAAVKQYADICKKCGASRIDSQIGSEKTSEEFVEKMVDVFSQVKRILRDDGILFLNLGDSYAQGGQLQGIPWRVALALQADGWILRSDIPWVKRSVMPESVTNRPCKSLEYVFMLTKSMNYYFDMDAVKPPSIDPESLNGRNKRGDDKFAQHDPDGKGRTRAGFSAIEEGKTYPVRNFRNADLWFQSIDTPHGLVGVGDEIVGMDMTSQAYPGSHFAVFGTRLIEPFILAGTSEYGACVSCGAPWKRVTERTALKRNRPNDYVKRDPERPLGDKLSQADNSVLGSASARMGRGAGWRKEIGNSCSNSVAGVDVKTLGWEKTCQCKTDEVRPCVVIDPFIGSGTTCCVAIKHGRAGWGIDLSEKYLRENAIVRIEGELLSRPSTRHLAGKKTKRVSLGEACD